MAANPMANMIGWTRFGSVRSASVPAPGGHEEGGGEALHPPGEEENGVRQGEGRGGGSGDREPNPHPKGITACFHQYRVLPDDAGVKISLNLILNSVGTWLN